MARQLIYMDYAAATPLDEQVLAAMQPFWSEQFYNPSASYEAARAVRQALAEARGKVAHWLGAKPSEIIFTAGGTEANNLAIHGVMQRFPKSNIVVSGMEHESVLEPARQYDCREVKLQTDGRIDLEDLRRQIDNKTVLVSLMYANNEVGTVQPLREIAKIVEEKRRGRADLPLYFHTDAAQAANYLDLHVARLGVDLMTLNGGKIYGPKQSGALYVRAGIQLSPLIQGGGQERGLRSGTENVAAAVGMAMALDVAQSVRHEEASRLQKLQQAFLDLVEKELPQSKVNGSLKYRLPNNMHLTIPDKDNERLLIELEEAGVLAAAGSACSASSEEPSHVLKALGLSDDDARASLRFTMGRGSDEAAVKRTVKALKSVA
ncbi:MAG TPA: cysteine desulfurase family protein [Candidatus Saccharimonadales bacterium]|nr:cysteine desulfurase family protein [Candidatus Saccharimonadales bacterium]